MNKNSKITVIPLAILGVLLGIGLAGSALASQNNNPSGRGDKNGQPPQFNGKMEPPSGTPKFGNRMEPPSGTPKFGNRMNPPSGTPKLDDRGWQQGDHNTSTEKKAQNGIAGIVSTISSDSMTINSRDNKTYTIDTTNASYKKNKEDITVSDILTGDMVIVQGKVNDSTITASTVIKLDIPSSTTPGDQNFKDHNNQDIPSSTVSSTDQGQHKGIFGKTINKVTSFFKKLFGKK